MNEGSAICGRGACWEEQIVGREVGERPERTKVEEINIQQIPPKKPENSETGGDVTCVQRSGVHDRDAGGRAGVDSSALIGWSRELSDWRARVELV